MQLSNEIDKLAAALNAAQAEIKAARMDAVNPFLKNKYATLNSVMDAIKPAMAAHGLSMVQLPTSKDGEIGLQTVIIHSSGQYISDAFYMPVGTEKGKSPAQVMGSILSYMRRYAASAAFGVVADEDTDGNQPQPKQQAKPQPKPQDDKLLAKKRLEFHAVGVKVYGDKWDDKRPQLVGHISKGKSKSSNDLNYSQLDKLVQGMREKLPAAQGVNWSKVPEKMEQGEIADWTTKAQYEYPD